MYESVRGISKTRPKPKVMKMTMSRCLNSIAILLLLCAPPTATASELPGGWESHEPGCGGLKVSVAFADDRNGWASGICCIVHTTSGGKRWTAQWQKNGADAYWFNSVAALSPKVAMASAFAYGRTGGIVLRTEDAGETWSPVSIGSRADAGFSSIAFTPDGRIGFVISNQEGLFRSQDGGLTWKSVPLPADPRRIWVATHHNISIPNNSTIFVAGDTAVNRSDDGGATWKALPLPAWAKNPARQFRHLYFAAPERGWAFLENGDRLETWDGGQTWTKSDVPGPPAFETGGTRGWAISQFEVYRTSDAGKTWQDPVRIGGGQQALVDITCTGQRAYVVGGNEGWGRAFAASRLLPGVTDTAGPGGVIPITFTLPRAGTATIQVLNDKDEVVENVAAGKQFPAGKNTVWWDLGTLDDFWPPFSRSNMWQYNGPSNGQPVAGPGRYHWRGLWHPGLSMEFKYSYYPLKKHGLAWTCPDGTGGWLGDHAPPEDVVSLGDRMWVGSFCEGGDCLLESDLDMKKLWGTNRIDLACPHVLAADPEHGFIYYVDQGGWLSFGGQDLALIQVDPRKHTGRRIMAIAKPDGKGDKGTARWSDELSLGQVEGLAVVGGQVCFADRKNNVIVVCDLSPNLSGQDQKIHVRRFVPVEGPGRIRPYLDGRLACVCKTGVVLLDLKTFEVTPVVTGCVNPLGLAVDAEGNYYVGEMEPVHQVKVFDHTGKLVRTIGKGQHTVGPFDQDHLESPSGIDVDSAGNVWVCENTNEMRRTSVWDRVGHCINQVLGSTIYGGGAAAIDPRNPNRLFARGVELARTPATGEIRPVNVFWRWDDPRYDRFTETFGGFDNPVPAHPFYHGNKLYFRMWNAPSVSTIWVYDHDHVRPVAACGRTPKWMREHIGAHSVFAWTDRNGDGKVQPDEVTFGDLKDGGAVWHVLPGSNFDVAFSTVMGDVGMAFFRVQRLTTDGYPVYRIPTAYTMVPDLHIGDPNQVQTCCIDSKGNAIGVCPYIFSLSPDGKVNWRYKCRWPGLHSGLGTTATGSEPGVVIAPIRTYGLGAANPEIGELVCFGSNYGATDLFTTADGLYIGRAFQDCRVGNAWTFNAPPTPEELSLVSLGQEHFGGTLERTVDDKGRVHFQYIVSGGGPSCSVVELHGLENVRRLPGAAFSVTPQDIAAADRLRQQREAEVKEPKRCVIHRMDSIKIDGKADQWPKDRIDGFALGYDDQNLYVLFEGPDDRAVFRNAATQANYMEAFIHGDVVDVMLQTKPGLDPGRSAAGEGDIRLSFAEVDGKPTAILYDYVVPGTPKGTKQVFSSPMGAVTVDQVRILPEAKIAVTRRADSYTLEASVPLASLHLQPHLGLTIQGDVGRVLSDQSGTTRVDRIYWSNKNTRTVKDVPTETRLQPNLWGTFEFGGR